MSATATGADQLGGELPRLDMAIDETLRLYPPAWIGPRRRSSRSSSRGPRVPGGVPVNYSSWASHQLPDVFPDPHAFRPERFAPEAKATLPKGAYVPFGGGSRTCIGMRFGQLEVNAIAARILRRFRLELASPAGAVDPPDAHALAPRRVAGGGARTGVMGGAWLEQATSTLTLNLSRRFTRPAPSNRSTAPRTRTCP